MTTHEEVNLLLEQIQDRAESIQEVNESGLCRDNVEFGLEAIESYCASIRGLVYEEKG